MKILKFEAMWCAPCNKMTEELKSNPLSINVYPIDVDSQVGEEYADNYKVTNLPCLVLIDEDEVELGRLVGYHTTESIENWISKYEK